MAGPGAVVAVGVSGGCSVRTVRCVGEDVCPSLLTRDRAASSGSTAADGRMAVYSSVVLCYCGTVLHTLDSRQHSIHYTVLSRESTLLSCTNRVR